MAAENRRWRAMVEYEVDLPAELDEGEASEMLGELAGKAFEDLDSTDAHRAMIRVAAIEPAAKT